MTCIFTNDGRGFHATCRTYAKGPFKMPGRGWVDLHLADTTVGRRSSCPANILFGSCPRDGLAASICRTSLLCCLAMENRHSPLRTVCRSVPSSVRLDPLTSMFQHATFHLVPLSLFPSTRPSRPSRWRRVGLPRSRPVDLRRRPSIFTLSRSFASRRSTGSVVRGHPLALELPELGGFTGDPRKVPMETTSSGSRVGHNQMATPQLEMKGHLG